MKKILRPGDMKEPRYFVYTGNLARKNLKPSTGNVEPLVSIKNIIRVAQNDH